MMAIALSLAAGLFVGMLVVALWPERRPVAVSEGPPAKFIERYPFLRGALETLTPAMYAIAPTTLGQLDHKLIMAGRPLERLNAGQLFSLAAIAAGLYAPLLLFALWIAFGAAGILLAFVLGIAGPFVLVTYLISSAYNIRARRLDQQFPYFLDFLVMLKEAGENLPMALRAYVNASGVNELGEAMRVVVDGVQNHREGLRGALMDFQEECPSEIGRSTLRSVVTAEEMGARSTSMLRDIARDMRSTRYEQAEKAAEQLRARSTIPAVVMFTGAFLIILAGSIGKLSQFSG